MTPEEEIGGKRDGYEWVRSLVRMVVGMLLVFTFVARPVLVDGESMRETLQDRDILLMVNRAISGPIETGDIVILRKGDFDDGKALVKRVIATGGQTVDIDFDEGAVLVDGVALDEPYIRERTHQPEGLDFPVQVPHGAVFVMGDNRNASMDSRHPDLGPVDIRYVSGRAVCLVVPGKTADLDRREWSRIGILN